MNLRKMTSAALIEKTKGSVSAEREALTLALHCFGEINRRRLDVEYKYKSLFQMVTQFYGYSEDQAIRRISAMHLMREIPEVIEKISSGELQFTNIGSAQTLFKQEAKLGHQLTKHEKIEILTEICAKSVRETEKIIFSHSSAPMTLKPDLVRSVSADDIEFRFLAKECVRSKIERLKGLLAHSNPNMTIGELFDRLCDLGIEEWQKPHRRPARRKADDSTLHENSHELDQGHIAQPDNTDKKGLKLQMQKTAAPKKRRVISAAVRRAVFTKAGRCCENCRSERALEIDHIDPVALGGTDELNNLRLLCRNCNQRSAIRAFGQMQMDSFLH